MPPRVGTHVNALKRKAAEDAKSQGREKRTRSSGVPPSHFIPLDGAPQPSKSINSSSPSAPHLVHLDKKKPRRPLQTAQPRLGTAPHDSGPDSRHSSAETNSEDEMSLKSAHNHSAHITSPQKDGKLVAEVEISPRKVNPITYKGARSHRGPSHPLSSSESEDELLLQSSPSKSTNSRAIALLRQPPRSSGNIIANGRSFSRRVGVANDASPVKRARFLSRSPSSDAWPPHKTRGTCTDSNGARDGHEDDVSAISGPTSRLRTPSHAEKYNRNSTSPRKGPPARDGAAKVTMTTASPVSSSSLKASHNLGRGGRRVVTSRKWLVSDVDSEADDESNATETETIGTQDAEGVTARPTPVASSTFKHNLSRTQRSKPRAFDSTPVHPPPVQSAKQPAYVRGSPKNAQADSSSAVPGSQERSSASKQSDLPPSLSPELQPFLNAQKSVSLCLLGRLRRTLPSDPGDARGRIDTVGSLLDLLQGTVARGEGNSCLVLGPRGSGKTTAVEEVILRLEDQADIEDDPSLKPIVIRLSGHVHVNDRIALTEVGRQLIRQNGPSHASLPQLEDDKDGIEEGDIIAEDEEMWAQARPASLMPPPSHMSSLVTTMSALPRPTIIVLDAFDLFTSHARQALLYCLLDTVQSCRAGEGRKGVAVVGITTRVDTLNLLEKRVKSRFSHRIIKCPPITSLEAFIATINVALTKTFTLQEVVDLTPTQSIHLEPQTLETWRSFWSASVESCLANRETRRVLKENFELTRDVSLLNNVLASALLATTPASPWLLPGMIANASQAQRAPDPWSFLCDLPFPPLALLIASFHLHTAGHDTFTFEHVYHVYSRAARQSTSTNVSLDGVVIGLGKVSRDIMVGAFENLISCKIFQPSGASSASTSFQFKKYRCDVSRQDVKAAIEAKAHTQLKRWLSRPT